jgi:hypothetical protein
MIGWTVLVTLSFYFKKRSRAKVSRESWDLDVYDERVIREDYLLKQALVDIITDETRDSELVERAIAELESRGYNINKLLRNEKT